jgi:hypothetical protein
MPYKAKLTTRSLSTSTITTDELAKGTELTFQQADSNFLNLRDQSIGIAADDSTTIDIGMGNTLKIAGSGTVTTAVSGQTLTITGTGGGSAQGITFVGDDSTGTRISDGETIKVAGGTGITTAVSGDTLTITATGGGSSSTLGDLQVNNTTLSPIVTNSDLNLRSNGTGNIYLDANSIYVGTSDFAGSAYIRVNPARSSLLLGYTSSTAGPSITLSAVSDIRMQTYSNGNTRIESDKLILGRGPAAGDTTITTDGAPYSGTLTLSVNDGANGGSIQIKQGSNADLVITTPGTGRIDFATGTSTTIGANGAASALTANPVGYIKIKVNGTEYQIPYYNI